MSGTEAGCGPSAGTGDLVAAAAAARANAYAPYSHFPVGAAVRTTTGRIFAACNVENASFPVGLCAEVAAVAAMVAAGERCIAEVLVLGGRDGDRPLTPCGACRQSLAEFSDPQTHVHCAGPDGTIRATFMLQALLPEAFDLSREPPKT